jgi:hypothetical protein
MWILPPWRVGVTCANTFFCKLCLIHENDVRVCSRCCIWSQNCTRPACDLAVDAFALFETDTGKNQVRTSYRMYAKPLTLILLKWGIWWSPNNVSKWQTGFNSAFKGLVWCLSFSKCKYFEMANVLTVQIMEAFSLWYI